jgi:hypothetical protein
VYSFFLTRYTSEFIPYFPARKIYKSRDVINLALLWLNNKDYITASEQALLRSRFFCHAQWMIKYAYSQFWVQDVPCITEGTTVGPAKEV